MEFFVLLSISFQIRYPRTSLNSNFWLLLFTKCCFRCCQALYWTKNEFSCLRRKFEAVVQVLCGVNKISIFYN
ncbi:hypothetical protein SLEP1_g43232 [Rubroshorea leprosula]|uniref:Uncharacterized protein n=1 Tax=Rubroshorea leprosula TaxID=152421 RepID=A0AAV5LD35_9ROSI|nr:hypothetical protein SLEP1_g43232 [Rubroshorea leprosula]